MLTKEQLHQKMEAGLICLDGATGSNLQKAGMPKGVSTEQWILDHPQALMDLQQRYALAGSQILYAPTFQAQPIALEKAGLSSMTEQINAKLVSLTRQAAPDVLVAGNLTTLAAFLDTRDSQNFDCMVENYRRQIRGLIDGGADLLAAETLVYPQDAEAILTAAELEQAGACMYSFTMFSDGFLFSNADSGPILADLESAGAAAVGFNCVSADMMAPHLVRYLRRYVRGPLLCKPNAGVPTIRQDGIVEYSMGPEEFSEILMQCRRNGATLLGGCCGTDPQFIRHFRNKISQQKDS